MGVRAGLLVRPNEKKVNTFELWFLGNLVDETEAEIFWIHHEKL